MKYKHYLKEHDRREWLMKIKKFDADFARQEMEMLLERESTK